MTEAFSDESKKQSSFNLFEGWIKGNKENSIREKIEGNDDQDDSEDESNKDVFEAVQPNDENGKASGDEKKGGGGWNAWVDTFKKLTAPTEDDGQAVQSLVEKAREFQQGVSRDSESDTSGKPQDGLQKLQSEFQMVFKQMEASFGEDIDFKLFNPISFNYFLEKDESIKTPSWKRRKHRFLDELDFKKVFSLHDALYLAEASYLDSLEDITEALEDYKGASYLLVYCQTEAEPREPAHFIAIKKGKPKQTGLFPWQKEDVLEILMVVRGTKEISDMLSDCLLESREYCDGMAHDGVCQSGLYLVEKHTEFLEHLLEESGRSSIRLSLIGHSLGAGAASIACIEFNKHEKIEATCIGFGCPALLNKELSEKWESKITTVVCDADCVPRMSKSTASNLLLDVMSNDWTDGALRDVKQLIDVLQINIPFELPQDKVKETLDWVTDYLSKEIKPGIEKIAKERSEVELYPPGKCIHMFRNGQGVSMHYVPCDFFHEFDVCYSMVDDHLIPSGYNRLLYEFARQQHKDSTFSFRNDVNALRAERHRRPKKESSAENNEDGDKES